MSYNKIIEELIEEKENIKHFFSYDELDFLNEITELRKDLGTYKNQHNKLFDENERLKQELFNLYLKHYN